MERVDEGGEEGAGRAAGARLVLPLVLALGVGLLLPDPSQRSLREGGPPLPALLRVCEGLRRAGDGPAAAMGLELLAPVTPPGRLRKRLLERLRGLRLPEDGPEVLEGERRLGEAMRVLPGRERVLLWDLTRVAALDEGLRARLLRLLVVAGPSRARLREVVRTAEGVTAWEAAVLLGRTGELGDAPALRGALDRWRGWGRQYALVGLVLLGDREALPGIRAALEDASPAVRRHAALALGALGEPRDRALLDALAQGGDPVTRRVVLEAKARILARDLTLP